jgi:hypothetical protein
VYVFPLSLPYGVGEEKEKELKLEKFEVGKDEEKREGRDERKRRGREKEEKS